jgi:hypothetical protein
MKFGSFRSWLSTIESIAVIGGIVFAVWQVLEISKQTTIQAETLKQSQQIASADLVLKLRATLDDPKFAKLVADLQNHDLIIEKMAYNEISYDVEKAWCNHDVQSVVADARKADKSPTRQTDPIYGEFAKLAGRYLTKEGDTCNDLDNQ